MSFSRLHKWVTYLLSGLGLIALSLRQRAPERRAARAGGSATWAAGSAEEPLLSRPWWSKGFTVGIAVALVAQVARGVADRPAAGAGDRVRGLLSISRLFNRRTASDYQQIAVLAFLHLIAATVLSTDLSYAAVFVGFVIATPWMLALSHLRREIEGNYPAESDVSGGNDLQRVLASKRVVGPRSCCGPRCFAAAVAMTLAIFVIFPRVGQGFLNFGRERGQRVAGFGNQVELGGFGVIRDDPTVVLRVSHVAAARARGARATAAPARHLVRPLRRPPLDARRRRRPSGCRRSASTTRSSAWSTTAI